MDYGRLPIDEQMAAFQAVLRRNPVLAPRDVYQAKTARWRTQWPPLTVLPWPGGANDTTVDSADR
jgi:hypothetical protein